MKALKLLFLLFVVISTGCKKDNGADKQDDAGYPARLTNIASADFLDKAKGMGIPINLGDNPPNIAGMWEIAPFIQEGGTSPVNAAMLNVITQEGTTISLENKYPTYGDPVLSQFIVGSGNNFTICHHYRMWDGDGAIYNFPYLMLISGIKDGNVLKNIKIARISLPWEWAVTSQKGDGGEVTIYNDKDGVSEKQ